MSFEFPKPNLDQPSVLELNRQIEQATKNRLEMLEQLAAAFVLKTNLDPREVELVEEMQQDPKGGVRMVWRFRKIGEA